MNIKPMKLMFETIYEDFEIIYEQTNENEPKFIKIRGPMIVTEKKNANGRIYSRKLMEEKSVPEYKKNWIDQKRSYSELNHPARTTVDPKEACDLLTSLEQQDNIWIGECTILSSNSKFGILGTVNGDTVASILQHGGRIGKSTRGVGEINESATIDSEYKLISCDTVIDPSIGAFVDGIFESKDFMINTHGDIVEYAYDIYEKNLSKLPNKNKEQYVVECFNNFIRNINKQK